MIPAIEVTSYRNKELLVVQVPHLAGPCFFKREGEENGVYVRFGSTNRKADRETIKALRLFASNKSFDELPSTKGLINEEYMKKMFKNINKSPTKKQYQMLGIYSESFWENDAIYRRPAPLQQ
ncbi:MAG: hypothetical protein KR126chlam3_00805 [Chlamydiae bacterium]|nr:hypothetical protein [Chlamydiota bacterium]